MQDISLELLADDSSANSISPNPDNEWLPSDNDLPSDALMFDDLLNTNQSITQGLQTSPMNMGNQSQQVTQFPTQITTLDEDSKFVDIYFTHYHTLYPILHEETFRSVQRGSTSPPHWPVLANAVLAIGAWLSSDAHQGLDMAYFARAEEYLEKTPIGTQGNLTLVQGLVLLSELAQKQGFPEKSGRYIGSSVQIAVALNLHVEPQDSENTELDKEICRRVWWSVYCAESCSAKIYGRPLLLPEDALITVKPVSNIHENVRLFLLSFACEAIPNNYSLRHLRSQVHLSHRSPTKQVSIRD